MLIAQITDFHVGRIIETTAGPIDLYHRLFSRVLKQRPQLKIIVHGYDNVIPRNGPWLGEPLSQLKITSKTLQKQIAADAIGRFNALLVELASEFEGRVFHADCRKLVGTRSKWHDELHPKDAGFFKVAKKIDETIQLALSSEQASAASEVGICYVDS